MKRNSWLWELLVSRRWPSSLFAAQPRLHGQTKADKSAIAGASQIAGLGSISGSVRASKEFKAAKVFARNVETKRHLHGLYRRRPVSCRRSVSRKL